MVCILHQVILNTKIIGHKAKDGFLVIMDPQFGCVLYGMIPKWSHMFHEFLVSDDTVLFESMHALFDAHVDPPLVVHQCLEVISVDDLLWDDFKRNPHKLRVW